MQLRFAFTDLQSNFHLLQHISNNIYKSPRNWQKILLLGIDRITAVTCCWMAETSWWQIFLPSVKTSVTDLVLAYICRIHSIMQVDGLPGHRSFSFPSRRKKHLNKSDTYFWPMYVHLHYHFMSMISKFSAEPGVSLSVYHLNSHIFHIRLVVVDSPWKPSILHKYRFLLLV